MLICSYAGSGTVSVFWLYRYKYVGNDIPRGQICHRMMQGARRAAYGKLVGRRDRDDSWWYDVLVMKKPVGTEYGRVPYPYRLPACTPFLFGLLGLLACILP